MKITNEIISKTKEFLKEDGINFFKEVKEKYGEIAAVWNEDGIPHSVHFNEGTQIRNFLRSSGLCDDWDVNDYDNNWAEVVERCINV